MRTKLNRKGVSNTPIAHKGVAIAATLALALALTLSCSSDLEMPPPPEEPRGSSSSAKLPEGNVYCKVKEDCVETPADMCAAASGTVVPSCGTGGGSSSGGGSLSSGATQSSSSLDEGDVYCQVGSTCSLVPKATCSILQGTVATSCGNGSSSSGTGGGSSSGGSTVSSSSRQTSGNVFTDARDGKVYEYEIANGYIWMSENLNYSKNGTIGYCYGTGNALGTVGANTSGCDSPYGRTYTYAEASASELCPSGWHLPSVAEWQAIGAGNGMGGNKGMMLSGFYVYAGNYNYDQGWKNRGTFGFYWVSDGNNSFAQIHIGNDFYTKTADISGDYFSVRCVKDKEYGTCGGVPYNVALQFCKDNSLYNFCGGKDYDPAIQRCGTGNIVETKCGTAYYNPATQFCYDNSVVAKCGGSIAYTPGIEMCCGSNIFTTATQFCSGTSIYSKCGGETYTPATQGCENNVILPKCGSTLIKDPAQECCGSNIFTTATQFCSGNTLYSKCGGEVYTPATQECISGVVWGKCGTGFYDLATHFCSDNTLYSKCGGETYNPLTQECTGSVVTGEPPAHKITCSGRAVSSCTGGGTYGLDVQNGECIEMEMNWNNTDRTDIKMRCNGIPPIYAKVGSNPVVTGDGYSNPFTIIPSIPIGTTRVLVCVSFTGTQTSVQCTMEF
jgi:uncharacterized protein (TIGR02145 family)